MRFGLFERLFDIADDSTASVGDDERFLGEGEANERPVKSPTNKTDEGGKGKGGDSEIPPDGAGDDDSSGGDDEDDQPSGDQEDEEGDENEGGDTDDDETPPTEDAPPVRPSIAELKKVYPELFKKFPSLRDMYFREKEYTELFPTVSEAKEASENNTAFLALRDDIMAGEGTKLISAIKEVGDDQLKKFATNVLPALYKASPDAHWTAATPLMQNIVQSFYKEGVKRGSDDLKHAAEHLSLFLFDDADIASGKKSVIKQPVESEESKQLKADRQKFDSDRYTVAFNEANDQVTKGMRSMVFGKDKEGRLIMDRDGVFSKFMLDTISDKVMEEVGKQLASDKSHVSYMGSLWEKAKKDSYNGDWKSKIISAYLARAKPLVSSIRAKYVAEALGTPARDGKRRSETSERQNSRREPGTSGRTSRSRDNGHVDARNVDWSKTSDDDILNDRVTYRK